MISKRVLSVILIILLAVFLSFVRAQTYRYSYIISSVTIKKTKYFVNQLSNIDFSPDKGTHSNFTAQQYGPDLINDTLTEENTGAGSDTLWLYVNTTDLSTTEWTVIGYPYNETLNSIDYPNYYIYTGSKNDEDGDYYFEDSGKSTETITNVTVQIYGMHSLTNKQLEVFVWDGSSWTSLDLQTLPTSWAWVNYTATTVLNTWAKIDAAKIYLKSSDNGANYHVDCGRLQIDYDSTTYEADLEVQWTNVDFDEDNEKLCIYGGEMGSENLQVDVWNGSSWQNVIASLNSGWNNVTVATFLDSSNFTIRFKGSIETSDVNQDSWVIDVTLLHVWT